jgi:abequosyltransferase
MQHERPLLTIAIPTYNRANYLSQLLSSLSGQLAAHPEVELLVSDNASTDTTPSVISEFESNAFKMRYVRNQFNRGADANFLQCFEQARGKYVWLVGDDDLIAPGSLDKVTALLGSSEYALIYLCPFPFRGDRKGGRDRDRFGRFAERIPNGSSFIRVVGPMITFISALIVNKSKYEELQVSCLDSFLGTNLIQLGWCLPVLGSGGESLIVWDRVLEARVGNSGGYGICRVFSENLNDLLTKTLPDSEEIRRILVNFNLREWFPATIIQIRYSTAGGLEDEDFTTLLKGLHGRNWRYWVYVLPVVTLPRFAARTWWTASQLINRVGGLLRLIFSYPLWRRRMISAH